MQTQTEGICYFAEPVRHQKMPQAKALSAIFTLTVSVSDLDDWRDTAQCVRTY